MKKIFLFILLFTASNSFAQKKDINGMLITEGNLIALSAKQSITSYSLMLGSVGCFALASYDKHNQLAWASSGVGFGIASAILYYSSKLKLKKAGELMEKNRISFQPVNTGLGVCVNF